ncbi:MAG: EamA family transporter [Clostridia bacterium]|nr:EamA family transporter [Clostridia bacterium]
MNNFYLILIASVLVSSFGNVLLKKGAQKNYDTILKEYLNPYVIFGYILIFSSSLLTILALTGIDYKNEPIIETLGYIFILIFSKFMLYEKLTKKKIIGNLIILVGILVYYL